MRNVILSLVCFIGIACSAYSRSYSFVSPNGQFLAYEKVLYDATGEKFMNILIYSIPEKKTSPIFDFTGECDTLMWINDNILALTSKSSDTYHLVSIEGKKLEAKTIKTGGQILKKSLSPDGNSAVYSCHSEDSSKAGSFLYEFSSGRQVKLSEIKPRTEAGWSADSKFLSLGMVNGYPVTTPKLAVFEVSTGKEVGYGIKGVDSSWSPGGKRIAYVMDIIRGGSWYCGVPCDGRIAVFDVDRKTEILVGETPENYMEGSKDDQTWHLKGSFDPRWDNGGHLLAYRQVSVTSYSVSGETLSEEAMICVDHLDSQKEKDCFHADPVEFSWSGSGDGLYLKYSNSVDFYCLKEKRITQVLSWEDGTPPCIDNIPEKIFTGPGVAVVIQGIPEPYGKCILNIIQTARKVFEEEFGFAIPEKIKVRCWKDPLKRTALWTDGVSWMFLRISSVRDLLPPDQSGVHNVYGICHEIGHMVMYSRLRNTLGIGVTLGEGWAHYTGSVIVDRVYRELGNTCWPQPHDISGSGLGRLRESLRDKTWEELDETDRGARFFLEIDEKLTRKTLGKVVTDTLADRPSGKEFFKQFIRVLKIFVPDAEKKYPDRYFETKMQWKADMSWKEQDFFKTQKSAFSTESLVLSYDDPEKNCSMLSVAGQGYVSVFRRPAKGNFVLGEIEIMGFRYGQEKAPDINFNVFICDQDFKVIREFEFPYSLFSQTENTWHQIPIPEVRVPEVFLLSVFFDGKADRGIYMYYQMTENSHSFFGIPDLILSPLDKKSDWMMRAKVRKLNE